MVTKIMQWVSIMALLLAVTWRPSVNYQIPLDFLVCAGAVLVVLVGEIKATVFGFAGQKAVRRAVKRILAKLKSERFNSLEITRVASKRFLGVPYASVSARSRHIQESMFLFRAKDLQEWDRARLAA